MICITRWKITILFFLLSSTAVVAEYRAYELEVFDRIANTSRKLITSFSPSDFIQVNGGPQRIGIIIRASWICYGIHLYIKKYVRYPKQSTPVFSRATACR